MKAILLAFALTFITLLGSIAALHMGKEPVSTAATDVTDCSNGTECRDERRAGQWPRPAYNVRRDATGLK
jgi:hypothetical protein